VGKRLVLLHTVPSLAESFARLASEILPRDVEVAHLADELLLKTVLAEGGLTPFAYRRVCAHVIAAEEAGADVVMLTCSSISPCVDTARLMVSIPVLKIDEPMVDAAISIGKRIGVVATVPTTLRPTTDLVRERAARLGRDVTVDPVLCEGAYDALFAGRPEEHDRIVRAGLEALMARTDVILLAQASMARVVDAVPASEQVVPILASPRMAMERARDALA
jgi:Asp/Glu/hydantoin racemase